MTDKPQQPQNQLDSVEKPNRTAFVREYLKKNPDAKLPEITTAWEAAGYPLDLAPSQAVLNNVNIERKKAENGTVAPRARLERGGHATGGHATGGHAGGKQEATFTDWLIKMEDHIDDAVSKAKLEGNEKELLWLRNLRRYITLKIANSGGLDDLLHS